jgi:hypothetical protein
MQPRLKKCRKAGYAITEASIPGRDVTLTCTFCAQVMGTMQPRLKKCRKAGYAITEASISGRNNYRRGCGRGAVEEGRSAGG